jgi:hypothetical protein
LNLKPYRKRYDAPKFVCAVDLIAEKNKEDPCLVYSVGSDNKIDFEVAVSTFLGCETHTFDPTLKSTFVGDKFAIFHPWGIGIDGKQSEFEWTSKGIETIMKELGHLNRTLDILKIDCEGCEYEAMADLFEAIAAGRIKVNQIQVELHGILFDRVERFFEAADKAKMRVFHKERNHWGCAGYKCLEYALISEDFLREANGASACNTGAANRIEASSSEDDDAYTGAANRIEASSSEDDNAYTGAANRIEASSSEDDDASSSEDD